MVETTILLKALLKQRHLQGHRAFCKEYDKVAGKVDPDLQGSYPSKAQFYRWLSGNVVKLPYAHHCRVLETMFPQWTAEQLFEPPAGDIEFVSDPLPTSSDIREETRSSGEPDPAEARPSASITAAYAFRSRFPRDEWWRLISNAQRRIDIATDNPEFLYADHPDLLKTLEQKIEQGCSIRLVIDPSAQEHDAHLSDITRPRGWDTRFHVSPINTSVLIFDQELVVIPSLRGMQHSALPLFHLHERRDAELFGRFSHHFEELWKDAARPANSLTVVVNERPGPPIQASQTPDVADSGREVSPLSRRRFLQGVGSSAILAPAIHTESQFPRGGLKKPYVPEFGKPLAHFEQMRWVLIDSDNLFGASRIIATVHEQISMMQRLRQTSRGADQRDLMRIQSQYAEFAGWLHQDIGDYDSALYWTDRAMQWSHIVGDVDITTFILARKAQLAGDMNDPHEAIDVAQAAMRMARPATRLDAVAATYAAHGFAMLGDLSEAERTYDAARSMVDSSTADGAWAAWLDEAYIDAQRARSLFMVGNFDEAATSFDVATAALPEGYPRDRGVYLARAARAHAGNGNIDRAAELGIEALSIGVATQSGRIMTELGHLDTVLSQIKSASAAEFHEMIQSTNA